MKNIRRKGCINPVQQTSVSAHNNHLQSCSRSLCRTVIILRAHDLLWILASYSFLSCPRFFSHLVHFKYFNVDGCHTLEFIINCEQSLGRWKVHLMTSGMKGVMLGMLTNADDLSSPSSFPLYRRILPQESQFRKKPCLLGIPKYSMG